MFDYPLPLPRHTLYDLLGVDPESSAEEISEARKAIVNDLTKEKNGLEERLEQIAATIAGLKEARLAVNKAGASPSELEQAHAALTKLEQKARQSNPEYRELQDRLKEMEEELNRINQLVVLRSSDRAEYDRRTPPLELLKLENCLRDSLAKNHIALPLLREELSRFFKAQGEEVFHPSDFTREDFTSDFDYHPLLDGEEP